VGGGMGGWGEDVFKKFFCQKSNPMGYLPTQWDILISGLIFQTGFNGFCNLFLSAWTKVGNPVPLA
jgi:hypothetical protein